MNTLLTKVLIAAFSLMAITAAADWQLDKGNIRAKRSQDIVITFSQDLGEVASWVDGEPSLAQQASIERACLALTLAQMLRNPDMNGGSRRINLTVFLRNDGVKLADPVLVDAISDAQQAAEAPWCMVPWKSMPITLGEHLSDFLAGAPGGDDDLVNCPICWCAYVGIPSIEDCMDDYDDEPPYPGVLNPGAIAPLFLGAEKVIDF